MVTTSISGLSGARGDEDGVSRAGIVESLSLPVSTLVLVRASGPSLVTLEGVVGEGGQEGIDSRGRAVRRLMVTLLEVGSGGGLGPMRGGVRGGAEPVSDLEISSGEGMESGGVSKAEAVSTDLLREPPRDTLWRFLEEGPLSSKGLGRVEQGSEEAARSRDNGAGSGSIWQKAAGGRENENVVEGGRWGWLRSRKL
jgi:hypothetical protein